ncbi:hypothetical protein ACTQ33_06960 [Candidatus Avoscillospira sp. LCP25S3_F1]|uniref:hypothetical protein n=1 Tax=Candidatus Avoscillospira sp. LCP25S3_F1 TaxID=3438825 RepID=UPI003F8FA4C3
MKNKKLFLLEGLAGILLIAVSFFVKSDYYSTMVFSMGFGVTTTSVAQLIRTTYWTNPKRREAYEAKQREAHINFVDERKQYLRMKAGHITYQIMTVALLLLALVLAVVRADEWIIAMVFVLFLSQWAVGVAVFRALEKRL